MINSKNISDTLGRNITNNSNKNTYKSIRNIFTKPKKKSSFYSLSRNKSNQQNLFSPSKVNKVPNKEIITNVSQYLNEINTLFIDNKSNNLSMPMNLSILVNKKNFQNSLKKDIKEKDNDRIKDFINKENMQKINIFKNYLNLSNLKNNENKFISLNIFNNNINKINNNINNINNISNVNNSYLLSPIKKTEEENSFITRNSQRINLNIKFPSITNSNNKLDTNNKTRSRNILNSNKNLTGNIINNNSSLLNNSSFLNFCTKDQIVSFNNDSQSILFSSDDNNIELQNKIIKNNNLREKFRKLSKPIKFNYNNSPIKKLKNISLKEINKSNIETERKNLKKSSFNKNGKYNFPISLSFSSIISNNLEKKKEKKENKLILRNINDKTNISNNENEGSLKNENNKTNIINNNSLSIKELLEKNKNDHKFEKSFQIIRKKSDNSKIIKNIGNKIKKGIRKEIVINNIKEEKKESIGGKIRKNIFKHKINEKVNKPENLKQSSIKTNNLIKEENQKNNTRKVKINSEYEESKTRKESPIRAKRKIKSSHYLLEYFSKSTEIDNENAIMITNKIKNNQLIGCIKSNKEKNIYQKNKFLNKLSEKANNINTCKVIKFSKAKLLIKENIELSSIIKKNNKNKNSKNDIEDIFLLLKEYYLNDSCGLLKQEINRLFEKDENIIGINIYEYSKTFLPNKKCKLNYNFINYISKNINFSSIYIPYVQKGKHGSIILHSNKLILYGDSIKIFFKNFVSKFIETHDSEEKKSDLLEIINKNVKIDLKWLKEYKDEEVDNLKVEKDDNLVLEKDNRLSINSTQSKKHRLRKESMIINRNNIKYSINIYSNKNVQNIRKSDKILYSPQKSRFAQSSKILGQQNNNFSLLTKSKFFDQKIEKVNINSSININKDNTKNINENIDSEKLRENFMNDEKVIQYLKYNPYVSMRKIMRDNSTKYLKDNGIEDDPFQFLKTLINEGESNKFKEYFSFVSEKLDINTKDEDGNTLLILCAKNGLINLSSLLLENGADVNKMNNKGNTALHYAISLNHFTLADLLAKYNAKENVINIFGYTPWECIGKSVEEKFYS